MTLSKRFQRILDRVSAKDRAYFEQYPGERSYFRDYVPGEFGPYTTTLPHDLIIEVKQLAPGVYRRRGLLPGEKPRGAA
jgi:hypothetical protein